METPFTVLAIAISWKARRTVVRNCFRAPRAFKVDLLSPTGRTPPAATPSPRRRGGVLKLGIDVITTGNHVWDNKDIEKIIDTEPRLLRPGELPRRGGGRATEYTSRERRKKRLCSEPHGERAHGAARLPLRAFDRIFLDVAGKADILIWIFTPSDLGKRAFGWYADGRASAVCRYPHACPDRQTRRYSRADRPTSQTSYERSLTR
jgi:hypothetical protein